MKNVLLIAGLVCLMTTSISCTLLRPKKYGCPSNGKNVDALKLANGDPDAVKAARKAKKFKS